ncbi:unnamed protein product [Aspergillus niger]|uniref:Contig An04c0220, genomic contig n=1 Tax=Aspergillus niger (strain ATCC MYA-4892 / CBS 513.88 / FGSC A1513) TaxID=425011 RepID=A2QJL8_ASPNC|nr:unnamed protein product [Aspergillus niger]
MSFRLPVNMSQINKTSYNEKERD